MYGADFDNSLFELRSTYAAIKTLLGKASLFSIVVGVGCWVYSYTSGVSFCMTVGNVLTVLFIPLILSYFGIDDVERIAIKNLEKEYEKKVKLAQKKERQELRLKAADDVRMFTVGISVDYAAKRKLTEENKKLLNKMTYLKLKTVMNKLRPDVIVDIMDDVALISSCNFYDYDKIYTLILKTLSKIKKETEERYALDMIVSTTTDAYNHKNDARNRKYHLEIKGTSFRNRACTTSAFSKKYKKLKQSKYMGVPIGEYTLTNENKDDFCELNIVYKNLSEVLENI